jgi:hypothetical protein
MTLMGIPSDPRSTLTNEEWRINTQLRLGLPLASYHNQPHALCPHGCRHPLSKELVNVRYVYHVLHHVLVTDCLKAKQEREKEAYQHSKKRLYSDPNPPARLLRAGRRPSRGMKRERKLISIVKRLFSEPNPPC